MKNLKINFIITAILTFMALSICGYSAPALEEDFSGTYDCYKLYETRETATKRQHSIVMNLEKRGSVYQATGYLGESYESRMKFSGTYYPNTNQLKLLTEAVSNIKEIPLDGYYDWDLKCFVLKVLNESFNLYRVNEKRRIEFGVPQLEPSNIINTGGHVTLTQTIKIIGRPQNTFLMVNYGCSLVDEGNRKILQSKNDKLVFYDNEKEMGFQDSVYLEKPGVYTWHYSADAGGSFDPIKGSVSITVKKPVELKMNYARLDLREVEVGKPITGDLEVEAQNLLPGENSKFFLEVYWETKEYQKFGGKGKEFTLSYDKPKFKFSDSVIPPEGVKNKDCFLDYSIYSYPDRNLCKPQCGSLPFFVKPKIKLNVKLKVESLNIPPKIEINKTYDLVLKIIAENIPEGETLPVTINSDWSGDTVNKPYTATVNVKKGYPVAIFTIPFSFSKKGEYFYNYKVQAPGCGAAPKNTVSLKTESPKKASIVLKEVVPKKGKPGQKFTLKVEYRIEGIQAEDNVSITTQNSVNGPDNLPFPEQKYSFSGSSVPNGAQIYYLTSEVRLRKKGNYAWNFVIDLPGFEPSKLADGLKFTVEAGAQENAAPAGKGNWVLKSGFPKVTTNPEIVPKREYSYYSTGYQQSFAPVGFTQRIWAPAFIDNNGKVWSVSYDWIFNFAWNRPPEVLKPGQVFDITFSGTTEAKDPKREEFSSVCCDIAGLKIVKKNEKPLSKYEYTNFAGMGIGPKMSGDPNQKLNDSLKVTFAVPKEKVETVKITIWSRYAGSVVYEYEMKD